MSQATPPPGWDADPGRTWEAGEPWTSAARPVSLDQLSSHSTLLRLRAARRAPVFTAAATLVVLYVSEILLANEAGGFMSIRLAGPLNVGLALSLLQCVTAATAIGWYARHARRVLDPEADRVRALLRAEGEAR